MKKGTKIGKYRSKSGSGSKQLQTRVPRRIYKPIKEYAKYQETTISHAVRVILQDFFDAFH